MTTPTACVHWNRTTFALCLSPLPAEPMFDPSKAPLVTETLLKKRRSLEELAVVRAETVQKQVKRRRVLRGENVRIVRPEQLVKARRIRDGSKKKVDRKRSQVEASLKKAIPVGAAVQSTVGFVVRIHEARNSDKNIKRELNNLGLHKKFDAIFFRLDADGFAKLKPLESYVAYGYVTVKTVEELVHRRSYVMTEGVKKPLSDNLTVEALLGDKNIICLNDLSHEIYNLGPHFDDAVKILCSFSLSSPMGVFEKKTLRTHATERGFLTSEKMDEFLTKIL